MATQTQPITVQVSKLISAPVEKVYKAWTEPEQMNKWFGCNKVASVNMQHELRVGGAYRIEAISCENGQNRLVSGTYKEIVPNEKLVYTWSNNSEEFPARDTLVTVEFVKKGTGTEVRIKHTNFALQTAADAHNMGWTECLEKLTALLTH